MSPIIPGLMWYKVGLFSAESYNGFVGGCIDPLVGGLAYHATAQIKILKHNLENLKKLPENQIEICIVHHQKILK